MKKSDQECWKLPLNKRQRAIFSACECASALWHGPYIWPPPDVLVENPDYLELVRRELVLRKEPDATVAEVRAAVEYARTPLRPRLAEKWEE